MDRPLRILLAEDNKINQEVATYMLRMLGYWAKVVGDGLAVLAALQAWPYDVVLMDIEMPKMDGLEATRRIREQWASPSHPWIIALTAHALPGDRERYLAAGMNDYLSKPLRIETLARALSRCRPQ